MEVWVNVFGNLDYLNLKVCAMVSKSWDTHTKHSSLDETLFRKIKPLAADHKFEKAEAADVVLHPALTRVIARCDGDLKDLRFVTKPIVAVKDTDDEEEENEYSELKNDQLKTLCKGRKLKVGGTKAELVSRLQDDDWEKANQATVRSWAFSATSAPREYATMPPMKSLLIKICDLTMEPVTNTAGVTVMNVMKVLYEHLFAYPAWYYTGRLGRVTGKRNGMSWSDFEDHEPDECSLAYAYLPETLFRGFDNQKAKQGTKEFVLCWKEQAMKDSPDHFVKTKDW
jgi:hypothetical protein